MAYQALSHDTRDLTFRFVSNVDGTDSWKRPATSTRRDPVHRLLEDVHDAGDDDQRARRATGRSRASAAMTRPWPSISSPSRPMPRRCPSSASTPPTCSGSGTGSAAAIPWTRRSGSRRCWPIGPDNFRAMLDGFHAMDEHFRTAPFDAEPAGAHGAAGVWYNDFFGAQTVAVLPYEQYLKRFPAYLQQLTMESNGKHVTLDGHRGRLPDRPDLLGRAGDQRPALVLPVDSPGDAAHPVRLHRVRPAAQSARAGTTTCSWPTSSPRPRRWPSARRPSRSRPRARRIGSCPTASSRATARRTRSWPNDSTPETLGKLVALYEHSVFTQGTIWNIDSFDQWGVELGKVLAQRIIPELESQAEPTLGHDSSTNNLIRRYRKLKETAR